MKRMKKYLTLLLALTLAACGNQNDDPNDVVGGDWRVTGVVRDSGSITRDGGDIDVLVCVNADSADFCYDDETYAIYDYVDYPITLQGDPWEEFRRSTLPTGTVTATVTWPCCLSWIVSRC